MADVSDKTINDVNNDTVINTTTSVDEEQVLRFILSTIEEQKAKKKVTCKNDIFKLCKENFSEDINEQNFSEHMNTLKREGQVIRKIYSKKESYSLVQTNERSDILTIKEELQILNAELSTFKDYVMADLLEMKQNNNERNENSRPVMNVMGDEFVSSQGENKNFIPVQHFQDEIMFLREKVGNKNEIIKTLLENVNFLKKFFLKIKIPLIILIKKV